MVSRKFLIPLLAFCAIHHGLQVKSRGEQCRIAKFDDGACYEQPMDRCDVLVCAVVDEEAKKNHYTHRAVKTALKPDERSRCGPKHICKNEECVEVSPEQYPSYSGINRNNNKCLFDKKTRNSRKLVSKTDPKTIKNIPIQDNNCITFL